MAKKNTKHTTVNYISKSIPKYGTNNDRAIVRQ